MHLNNSRADEWLDCRRRYYWNQVFGGLGLQGRWVDEALGLGTIIHAGMAELYSDEDYDLEKVNRRMRAEFAAIIPDFEQLAFDDKNMWLDNMELAERLVRTYAEEMKPNDDFTVVQLETPFSVILGEICWQCGKPYPQIESPLGSPYGICADCEASIHHFVGRVDMAVNRQGGLKIVDHKTAKSVSANYLESWHYSMQLVGYAYGYGKALGTPVTGYGVNIIRKLKTAGTEKQHTKQCPACRGGSRKKLTCTTCNGEGRVEKEADSSSQPFQREWESVKPEDVERFQISRIGVANEIEAEAIKFENPDERLGCYPMNPKKCFLMKKCPYIPLCYRGDPQEWWNPSETLLQDFDPKTADYVEIDRLQKEEMK